MQILDGVAWLAYEAGRMILTDAGFTVENKGTKENYVTSTDRRVEVFLKEGLSALLPEADFLGEEGDDLPGDSKLFWVVDPIDGTANYARGIPASTVSIGLVKDGVPVLGVVRNPYTDETFCAQKGRGAYLNGRPIKVSQRTREHCMVATAWSCYNKSLAHVCFQISERLYGECEDIRRIGTAAYALCLLAKGAEDLMFEIRLSPWDYMAGIVILEEAGGCHSSLDGPVELTRQCTFLAANNQDNLKFVRDTVLSVLGDERPYR